MTRLLRVNSGCYQTRSTQTDGAVSCFEASRRYCFLAMLRKKGGVLFSQKDLCKWFHFLISRQWQNMVTSRDKPPRNRFFNMQMLVTAISLKLPLNYLHKCNQKFWTENSPHVAMSDSQTNHSEQSFEPDQPNSLKSSNQTEWFTYESETTWPVFHWKTT